MAEKTRNARKITNVFAPQNRGKVGFFVLVTIALAAWGVYINSSDDREEIAPPAMQSDIQQSNIQTKKDVLGQTQLTNDTRILEQQLDKQKVDNQVRSGQSAIMERKNELNPISYQPKQKLTVVEVPKVETPEIEVQKVQETTEIRVEPPKEVAQQIVESYRAPSYAQSNRQAIDDMKNKMATSGVLKVENQSNQNHKFTPVVFSYYDEYQADKIREQELAKKLDEIKMTAEYTPVKRSDYMPSDRVVNDQTAGFNKGLNNILFRAGERVAAITLLKASSQQLGTILAVLAEGPYAGAELMGTVSHGVDKLNFNFTSMWLPNEQIRIPISATARQFEDQSEGTATDVDNRVFRKYILKPILKGIGAAGQYYAQEEGTTVTNNAGVVVESRGKRTADVARKVAYGSIADTMAEAIDDIDTTQIVTQDQNTPIIVMFMADVTSTPELKQAELENTAAEYKAPVKEPSIEEGAEMKTSDIKTDLTREEALALQKTGMAQDPKVQAAIIKALATQ